MRYKSILVVTYGRSGSTLLQGVLNSIPGCLIRGENENFIFPIFNSYRRLKVAKATGEKNKVHSLKLGTNKYNTPRNSWYGADKYDLDYFIEVQKNMIKDMLLSGDKAECYGFKEVRYISHLNSFKEYLDFLELVMEDTAIVFNVRNHEDVSNSSWWKKTNKTELIKKLQEIEIQMNEFSKSKNNVIKVSYEKIVDKSDIKKLFNFLDVKYNESEIARILATEHSHDNKKEI